MLTIGQFHLATAIVALVAGAWVLPRRKGTRAHRRAGWVYVGSMLALNVSALLIYRLTGRFGPFHIAALVSLGGLIGGIVPMLQRPRRANWLEKHYFFMSYSYLGLVAAAVAETSTRVPALRAFAGGPTMTFWIVVALATFAVMGIGSRVVRRRVEPTLRPFRRAASTVPAATGARPIA